MRYAYYFAVFALLAGCSTVGGGHSAVPERKAVSSQQDLADQARDYLAQAQQFREMAERRAVEAELQANELGPEHDAVKQKRKLVRELNTAADEAEQKARRLRQEVPHGMVQ